MTPCDYSRYPDDWNDLRNAALRAADQRCQGCGAEHYEDGTNSTILTVHHPDRDPENAAARLTVLCAGCHLAVEGIARRRQRIADAAQEAGITVAEAWRRARAGIVGDQLAIEVPHD